MTLDPRLPPPAGQEDGDAAGPPPAVDAAASSLIVRRTPAGHFIDGPSPEVRRLAGIRRSATVRQRRYLVTRRLLDTLSHGDIADHYARIHLIITEGAAKDAVAAFKALYSLVAVPPSEDTRVLGDAPRPEPGQPLPPGPREVVIVMPSPPER